MAVEHLIQVHGHDTVGAVVGGVDSPSSDPRERGWGRRSELPAWRMGLSPSGFGPAREVTRAAAAS